MLSRRRFVAAGCTAGAMWAARSSGLRIGTMDTVLRLPGKPESIPLAKQLDLAAVQVTIGKPDGQTLPLENPELQSTFLAASAQHGIPIAATYLDVLHVNCLKQDRLAGKWVEKGIAITQKLKASVLMTVFFGKCAVLDRKELDYTIDAFRELVPHAERAGIVLGFENTLPAAENLYAVDRLASPAFRVWYDVGNSTFAGYDVPREIRLLGRDRICQFHFKDRGYLGEGAVNFPAILRAIDEIGFQGYAHLETTSPSGSVEADTRRNIDYLRRLGKT